MVILVIGLVIVMFEGMFVGGIVFVLVNYVFI